MGHYASEMGGYDGPSNKEEAEQKISEVANRWAHGLSLFNSGHQGRDKWTCPRCFVGIEFLFMEAHDAWHARLNRALSTAGMFGTFGAREV